MKPPMIGDGSGLTKIPSATNAQYAVLATNANISAYSTNAQYTLGSTNVSRIAVFGDSMMAGVGAESINAMPNKVALLGAPFITISQTNVTRNKDGVDYTHYTGC